jgi:uncharacterized protein Yka (UPF0111/DUF47 family)
MNLTPEIINLGALAVVFMYFIDKVFSYFKSKKDKNSNNNIFKLLNVLKDNDLSEISKKIERLEDRMDNRFDEIIKILGEIKEKIRK